MKPVSGTINTELDVSDSSQSFEGFGAKVTDSDEDIISNEETKQLVTRQQEDIRLLRKRYTKLQATINIRVEKLT